MKVMNSKLREEIKISAFSVAPSVRDHSSAVVVAVADASLGSTTSSIDRRAGAEPTLYVGPQPRKLNRSGTL